MNDRLFVACFFFFGQHLSGCFKKKNVNHGKKYQSQLVNAGFFCFIDSTQTNLIQEGDANISYPRWKEILVNFQQATLDPGSPII